MLTTTIVSSATSRAALLLSSFGASVVKHRPRRVPVTTVIKRNAWWKSSSSSVVNLLPKAKSSQSEKQKPEKKEVTKMQTFLRLLKVAEPEKKRIGLAVGFLAVSSSVTLSVPYFIGSIIDIAYQLQDKGQLLDKMQSTATFLVTLFVMGAAANGARIYLIETSGQRIIQRLRKIVFQSVILADVSFFDQSKTGELLNRLSNDTDVVGSSLTYNVSDGLRSTLQILGGISLMTYTSPKLTLCVMCVLPPVVISAMMFGRYLKKISRQVQDVLASSTEFAEERLSSIRLVKGFAKEGEEMRLYGQKVDSVLDTATKEVMGHTLFYTMNGFAGNFMILGVFYYGGVMVNDASLTVGGLSSFIMYSTYVGISIGGLTTFYAELMKAIGASGRLFELLDYEPSVKPAVDSEMAKPDSIEGSVSFHNVSFVYPTRPDVSVLNKFNLEIPTGQVTALVGKSGCGKSTVASLLMRYYDPNQGKILIDNLPLDQYCMKSFRSHVSFVSQDPIMFSSTIRENIEYGSVDSDVIDFKKVEEAAEVANCLQFINSFPNKFDTLVGERGIMLSGGQRQRLAIARAIIRNPTILILDEATSALDSESERLVQDALQKILPGRTVLQIAHRLATIRNANSIAVIDQGRVVEQGSYEQLMAIKDGHLSELVNLQLLPETN